MTQAVGVVGRKGATTQVSGDVAGNGSSGVQTRAVASESIIGGEEAVYSCTHVRRL
jgi:hypothetical protein